MTARTAQRIDAVDEAQLLQTIDRWLERDVKPIVRKYDHDDLYPTELVEQMKALGLFGATISSDYGGLGLPATTYARLVMRISSIWMAITGIFNSHLMLALAIEKFGTPAQKASWLPRLATGEVRGGLALTEPDAGTDLQGIRMTARADGDSYLINGTKTWISNGIEGSCFRTAGEDRSQRRAALQGHEPVHRPQAERAAGRQETREARLQIDQLRRADLRGLPDLQGSPDRRGRRSGLLPGNERSGAWAHQHRRPRRWPRRGRAPVGNGICADTQDLRKADLRASGHSVETRGHGHTRARGPPAHPRCRRSVRRPASAATCRPV